MPFVFVLAVLQFTLIIAFIIALVDVARFKLIMQTEISQNIICILFVIASVLSLLCTVLQLHSLVRVGLSLFVSSFLPGYVIVRLTRIGQAKSIIENVVLSYALSLPITASIGTIIFSYVSEGFRDLALALAYLLLSLILLTPRRSRSKIDMSKDAFEVSSTVFLFLITILLFFLFIFSFYPLMAYVPGLDIARHFGAVQQIIRAPELLQSFYPWFNFYEVVFYRLGKPSLEIFQTVLALSSLIMILAFYSMASIYLKKVDQRLPTIATFFWSIFGGFGWLSYLREALCTDKAVFDLLTLANDISYLDISIPRTWFWFRPMIVAFTLFFVLLYLLKQHDLDVIRFTFVYSIFVISLVFFHLPQIIILVIVLSIMSLFAPLANLRLKEAVLSTIIGILAAFPVSLCLYYDPIFHYVLLGLLLPLIFSYLLLKFNWKGLSISHKIIEVIVYIAIIAYIAGLMSWLANPAFSTSMTYEILFVPWLLYPVRLGLVGLLGLIGLLAIKKYSEEGLCLFAYMFFSTLVFARFLSYVNIYFFPTNFYEQRFIQAALLPSTSILAALAMKSIIANISLPRNLNLKRLIIITLTSSLIVIVGTNSVFLAYDYHIEASRRESIGGNELSSVYFLSDVLYNNPKSPVLTLTARSITEVEFAGPILIVNPLHLPAWASLNPEIPLIILFRGDPRFTAPYIYLHERDRDMATKRFPEGVLLKCIIPLLPLVYQNEKVKLYKMVDGSPPLMNSSTVLLMPFDQKEMQVILPVLLSLSLGGYEYTIMLDSDTSALKKDVIIIPVDSIPEVIHQLLGGLKNSSDKKLIVFNTKGYGSIGKELLSGPWKAEYPMDHVKINRIEGREMLTLPFDLELIPVEAKNNVEVLGYFSGGARKIPFVVKRRVNGTEVIYVNIYPLMPYINSQFKDETLTLLRAMLNIVELGLKKFYTTDYTLKNLLFFKDAIFEGNITIRTSSIIFSTKRSIPLKFEGDAEARQVLSILLSGIDNVTIKTNYGQIGQGLGFYTQLTLSNPTLELNGKEIKMKAVQKNGGSIHLNVSSTLKFKIEDTISIYTRTPTLSITGNATFKDAYGLHQIYKTFRVSGHKLQISGDLSFAILASDVYTITKDLIWQGLVQRDPPILQWDELKSLQQSIPWFILSTIIFLVNYIILSVPRKRWKLKIKKVPL